MSTVTKSGKGKWGHARIRVNNRIADVRAGIRADGLHEYVVVVGQSGPRESVKGPLGRAAAGMARAVLSRYEKAKK